MDKTTDHPLLIRQRAAEACLKRFDGQRLDYRRFDCIRLSRLNLTRQGVAVRPLKGLRWTSQRSALRAMKGSGFVDLCAGLDAARLPRIAWSRVIIGDMLALQSDTAFGAALMVALGSGAFLGLDDDEVFRPVRIERPETVIAAWRTL